MEATRAYRHLDDDSRLFLVRFCEREGVEWTRVGFSKRK